MEGIWEAMRDLANPCSVLTKSPLLLRDIGLMKEIAERTEFTANLSIPTLDEKAWRATEPHTPHPRKRIEAVAELKRAGIRTGVLIAPLIPGVNDSPEQVEPLLELAHRGRRRTRSAASACTCAARCARSGSTGCASTAPTCCRATRSCTSAAPTCGATRRDRLASLVRRGGRVRATGAGAGERGPGRGGRRGAGARADRGRAQPTAGAAAALF